MSIFITDEDLQELTGYIQPSKQIVQLRKMGIPFRVNAANQPRVTASAVEGSKQAVTERQKVVPAAFTTR